MTHALLGSYAVQSDLGDYDVDEHEGGIAYIKDMQFAPQSIQTDELLDKIAKLHVLHRSVVQFIDVCHQMAPLSALGNKHTVCLHTVKCPPQW